jgi:hypothetical protein
MSFQTKCICDECGAIKGDANHWLVGRYPFFGDEIFFSIGLWTDAVASKPGVLHLCGDACMQRALGRFVASRRDAAHAPTLGAATALPLDTAVAAPLPEDAP